MKYYVTVASRRDGFQPIGVVISLESLGFPGGLAEGVLPYDVVAGDRGGASASGADVMDLTGTWRWLRGNAGSGGVRWRRGRVGINGAVSWIFTRVDRRIPCSPVMTSAVQKHAA